MAFPTWSSGDTANLTKLNQLVDELNDLLGNLDNSHIASGANIDGSKIADGSITSAKFSAYSIDSSSMAPTNAEVVISAQYTLTQEFDDMGISFTVNPSVDSVVDIDGAFVFASIQTDAGPCKVRLLVDGEQKGGVFSMRAPADDLDMRTTIPGIWLVDIDAGSHTFTFQAEKTNPGDGTEKLRGETRVKYKVWAQA